MPVYSVNGDYVALAKEDTLEGSIEDLLETYRIKTNSIIFKFDSQSKEFKKIQPSDIKSYKNHPADYDKMYLCTAAGNAKVFVVYENDNNEIVE